jgi:predicted alpha/beta hydrolase family esterase
MFLCCAISVHEYGKPDRAISGDLLILTVEHEQSHLQAPSKLITFYQQLTQKKHFQDSMITAANYVI